MDISSLKAIGGDSLTDSILTDEIFVNNASSQANSIKISVGEYAEVMKNFVYYIYSDNIEQ
jgi:hypothetical protein